MNKNNNQHLFDQIMIMKSNPHYRLGDIILNSGDRWEHDYNIIANNDDYKNTILRTYIDDKIPNIKIDRKCLSQVINQFSQNVKTDEDTLYVHLRLGDVVMDWNGNISRGKVAGRNKGVFLYNQSKLNKQIDNILSNNRGIKRLQIITSLHFGDNKIHNRFLYSPDAVTENRVLFNEIIKNITMKFNLPISVHISELTDQAHFIDQHVSILSSCKHVIYDGGGFGRVIKLIRQIKKMNV